jgi:endonuclease/exonuclease/phosphatase family metal-dependent hydrolase
VREGVEGGLAALLLAIAIGGGSYMIPADASDDLRFVEVGWWNIRNLSSPSRDDREISLIAKAIDGAEVLAVGELNDPDALRRIAARLGPQWRYEATDGPIGNTAGSSEYYGVLWNSADVEIVGSINVDPDPANGIERDPAWASFRTTGGTLDFTVVAVHVTWSGGVPARRAEIREMADVWERVQAATPLDNDIILVGDFNRNVGDEAFEDLLAIPGVVRANEETGPTHISSSSTYDQIFISLNATQEWTGEYETLAFDETLFRNDDRAASLAGSDHRPVWITLYVPGADDD